MNKLFLDAQVEPVDGDILMAIEKAKRATRIDWSYTCFKGKTHLPATNLKKCMWLAQEKKDEPYI